MQIVAHRPFALIVLLLPTPAAADPVADLVAEAR
jgi:hypothetical protein